MMPYPLSIALRSPAEMLTIPQQGGSVVCIPLLPQSEFLKVRDAMHSDNERLALIADMCRFNCLSAVKRAGSGHLGSSFSAMDIVVWLYFRTMNTLAVGIDSADRDVYFSSKGHDVPGLYAVLHAAGLLSIERLMKLRRLGGLDGHPDVGTPGIEANSGSLGMGISKGKGMAFAKRALGHRGRVFVLTGDGELQEGQNYEALQTGAMQGCEPLIVIVDHNKFQTDKPVSHITALGDLEAKFRAFGWTAIRCNGHSFEALDAALAEAESARGNPCIIIADTIKGRGVSFMEAPELNFAQNEVYRWHSGAPDDNSFAKASDEILTRIVKRFSHLGLGDPAIEDIAELDAGPTTMNTRAPAKEYVADAFGEALLAVGARRSDVVVLDGDLAADCRIRTFEERFPERFIENGIAEQDMVSTAGGLARMGMLPVVNSFANFLASRANEQIYNNATERTKVIYVCHFGGLIPAGPGKSHQSIRDIALFSALPNSTIIAPGNPVETRLALDYFVDEGKEVCVLRLAIGPSPRRIELPADYSLIPGRGTSLNSGSEAIMFAYGPVMLHEALVAAETLAEEGFGLRVVNHPWVNLVDAAWLRDIVQPFRRILVLDDHGPHGALGDRMLEVLSKADLLAGRHFQKFAVTGFPACGAPGEVLRHHGLDGASIAAAIRGLPVVETIVDEHDQSYSLEAPQ